MKFSAFTLVPLLVAQYVSAHGITSQISIQGKVFQGNRLGGPTNPSVIRQVSSQDPNKGANNPALTCGPNATPATLVADANPGDTINFDWRTASGGPWPHNTGPMLTYLASCGSVTCDKFNQVNAQWFKIDQVGKKPGNPADWVQKDLMTGGVASVVLPRNLAPGNYLIRHEIIALHLATSVGGAEFYPACAQLKVGGSGTGVPKASELVKLPGAYSDNDPGIFAPNVFDPAANYVFPGPPIATLVEDQSTPPSPSSPLPLNPSLPASSASSPTVTPQPSPSPTKSGSCRKKNRSSSSVPIQALTLVPGQNNPPLSPTPTPGTGSPEYRPRRLSHIMRRIALENSFHH
jgi:hypothetical protein